MITFTLIFPDRKQCEFANAVSRKEFTLACVPVRALCYAPWDLYHGFILFFHFSFYISLFLSFLILQLSFDGYDDEDSMAVMTMLQWFVLRLYHFMEGSMIGYFAWTALWPYWHFPPFVFFSLHVMQDNVVDLTVSQFTETFRTTAAPASRAQLRGPLLRGPARVPQSRPWVCLAFFYAMRYILSFAPMP